MDGAEEDTDSEVEEYSGMEQPPLIKQLKTILAEYPDDGQIIKELVQNAEDAEASYMKILYDGRTINTATMKKLPYRKFFKAPALCFYNNEVFSENDWRGIKMIYSSVKEEDPLKVGRFGLGFKSVFHITDNPCIISGNKILLMNPHEKVPDKVCITMKLKDLKKCKRMKVEEFLHALMGTFGFLADALNSGNYNGTLFWFPLRESPSELSDTCYDQSKVLDLFKSYKTEAVHSLLFLKSLRKVELCSRCSGTAYDLPNGQEFFSVELSDGDGRIKEGRSEFLREIKDTAGKIPDADIVCVAHPKFKTRFRNADMLEVEETERSWLVINVYKGGNMSEKLTQLVSDRELSYSPYVGAAVLLSDCGEPFKGHVFCFLPLPQEMKSLTGLPIHFNGFFALSQNRRHLKWASADQETLHMHRDKAILWNERLVNEVLPEVYMLLIKEMITISCNFGNNEEAVEAVYKCIPDISAVDDKWSGCVNSLYQQLMHTDIVFLPNHSKWVQPLRPLYTVFDQQNISCDKKETVIKTVNQYKNVETTTVPIHVWELLRKIAAPKDITPSELCKIMRSDGIYKHALEASEKMKLLEYITKDKEVELLKGLELLPVEQGSFVTFQDTGSRPSPVYFCTKEETLMFPGLEDRFVSTEISTSLEDVMRELATSGRYQVQNLTITDTVSLLETTVRQELGQEEPIALKLTQDSTFSKWIENVWVYIFKHYSCSLQTFENLPLIPCLISDRWDDGTWRNGEVHLYTVNRSFILESGMGIEECPNSALQALTYLSVIILPSLPEWFDAGKFNCIFIPTGTSLLRLLDRLQSSNDQTIINRFNNNCKASETEALVTLLARISSPFSDNVITFLRKLHLFKQCTSLNDASAMVTSVNGNSQVVNFRGSFPVRFPQPLLVSSSHSSLCLAKTLRAKEINEEQLVIEVLKAIHSGSYRHEEVRTFMMWFLTNIHKFQWNENVMSHAKNVSFVPNGIRQCKPYELYDPRDANMLSLFQRENKFPVGDLASELFLNAMHHLGLKKKQDISANCLHATAKELDRMCTNGRDTDYISQKAKSLFEIFEEKVDILSANVAHTSTQLQTAIRHLKCIPHKRERPANYPKDLVWKGSEVTLCSPIELKSDTFSNTVGSVIPLVQTSNKLGQTFQWNAKPGAKELTEQLENIITAYSSTNKPDFLPLISNVNRAMAEKASELISYHEFKRLLQTNSIWWGDGFCSTNQIILERRKTDIDLQPYMYPIPAELQSLEHFFTLIGCHRWQDTNALLSVLDMISRKHQTQDLTDETQTRKDLYIVLQILNKLFQEKDNIAHLNDRLLFPVHTSDNRKLVLKSCTQCTYCDAQWLKELTDADVEDEEIIYVHGDVPSEVAEGLGVKSLKKQLMSDAEGLEEWGQEEPLTRRLHNILKDGYVDGLAVPKEIIQNADDAQATTVQFLYDERENSDARTQLLDEEMSECQGPALWAYNDSFFSNDDLKNITKLSGATKETDTTKIGKFGLGFCAVYNLTDVPSFVSGQNMVLFDPHTKYLNKALPGNSPGLKINLRTMRNKRLMKRMNNQFKPFQGVFGCDLSQKEPYFHGTLFRLPLRTKQQAVDSEIKNTAYPKEEMLTLLKQFVEASGNMLLFTQNIQEIKLFHIPPSGVPTREAQLLCTVTKQTITQSLSKSVLDICSDRKISKSLQSNPFATIQQQCITVTCEKDIDILGQMQSAPSKTNWLVSWATGKARSLELCYSTNITGALPLGSVALLIESGSGCLTPKSLHNAPFGFYKTGHIFCYLPLPIESQLDVHLNGSFAVTSNRRGLQTRTEDDKYSYDSQWNEALLADALALAFVNLLVCLHSDGERLCQPLSTDYQFHQVWPVKGTQMMSCFKQGFYRNVVLSNSSVFESYGNWLGLKHCIFLGRTMAQDPDIRRIALSTLQKFRPNAGYGVVDLPPMYHAELQSTSGWKDNSFVVEEEDFFLSYYLPNINDSYWDESEDNCSGRHKMMLYCLEHSTDKIDEKLKLMECIPTKPNWTLRKPQDLVHPTSYISPLFSISDERFPDDSFGSANTLCKLVDLGMMKASLEPDIVIDRASSISKVSAREGTNAAIDRCKHFLAYLSKSLQIEADILQKLKDVSFLPVMEKPENWPFKWKSESLLKCDSTKETVYFEKPDNLFLGKCKKLVACEKHILDSHRISSTDIHSHMFEAIGVKTASHASIETVINQLLAVCNQSNISKEICNNVITDEVLDDIYLFLNKAVSDHPDSMKITLSVLQDKHVIRLGSDFLPASKVAFSVGHNCTPDLYEIGVDRIVRYRRFLECIGVKERFEVDYVVQVLKKKTSYFQDTVLPKDEMQLVSRLLRCLTDLMMFSGMTYDDLVEKHGKESIIAPDDSMILRPTFMLCFDDCNFVQSTSSMKFINSDVSLSEAVKLGVLTKRRKHMEECSKEIPFEQKEELVTRLKRLLDGYPCDIAILKELIQNADDAKATEIHFVKDLRTHNCETIFDETFSEFQGPALCVFNDSCFTQADLVGIQRLGIGSKGEDPAKTGQYGVGFNAVYNLTDLPSFLTKGPDIEGNETLCMFDPLQKHSTGRVGTRYIDMQAIRTSYPDILSGYNEDIFFSSTKSTGTVFRFPLRQSQSDISSNVISPADLDSLFASFKRELSEMLLFLKHVTKITLSTVSSTELTTERSVSTVLSDEDMQKRDAFFNQLEIYARELKNKYTSILTLEPFQVNYQVQAKNSLDKEELWYVVQRIGLSGENIPQSVETAVKNGRLGMLPIGGVAVRLPKTDTQKSIAQWCGVQSFLSARSKYEGNGRAYCFLPLPGTTGLPLHVNGHFILDHEARRGLWRKEHHDEFKSDWNQLLLSNVLSTTYVEALNYVRSHVLFQDDARKYSDSLISDRIAIMESFFPLAKEASDKNWKFLVQSVLQIIIHKNENLFPVTQEQEGQESSTQYTVNWVSFCQEGHTFPVYFTQSEIMLSIKDPLHNLLRKIGMKITNLSRELQKSFDDSQIAVPVLDSNVVLQFVKSYSGNEVDKVKIDQIPYKLEETLYRNVRNVDKVLDFCSRSETFETELGGLPLLVTNDGVLRCFNTNRPVYCTKYATIFPNSSNKFVHEKQMSTIKIIGIEKFSSVISPLRINNVADLLPSQLESQQFTRQDAADWDPSTFAFPNKVWICTLWTLLTEDYDSHKKADWVGNFEDYLQPLQNWCLIPAYKGNASQVLVKISKSYSVLSLDTFTSVAPLAEALQKLELPCLNTSLLSVHAVTLLSSNVGRAENPVSVLVCLKYYREEIRIKQLSCNDCYAIMGYFSDNLKAMQEEENIEQSWIAESLRCLPLFVTKEGHQRSFENQDCRVLVLPNGIPDDGLQQWAYETGTVLLRNETRLKELFRFLGFTYTKSIDVYLEHILKNWVSLPDSAIITHLKYIKDHLLASLGEDFDDKQTRMLQVLQDLPVIADRNGRMKACAYFSPHHRVFQLMCKPDEFPPKVMCAFEWKRFLELIGLKHQVSGSLIIRFANEIASEGRYGITEASAEKSQVLVEHLHSHSFERDVYQDISDIKFVVPHTVDSVYTNVHKQYIDPQYFICFANSVPWYHAQLVWSSVPLVPKWADPRQYYKPTKAIKLLGVYKEPPIDSVIKHTQNVCGSLKSLFEDSRNVQIGLYSWIEPFMEKLYEYLQIHGLSSDRSKQQLYHTPLVFIPEAILFVPAHQVIEDMTSEQEISPYLLKAPPRYGKFFPLFIHLGAEKYPSFMHYIKVLAMIKEEVGNNKLSAEYLAEWGVIRGALENLFYLLKPVTDSFELVTREIPHGTVLYLPSREQRMANASELTVADNQYYENRLGETSNLTFLMDLKAIRLSFSIISFRWLPEGIRPKFLSNIVKEKVDTSEMIEISFFPTAVKLESFLHSDHFIGGVLRLVKHFKAAKQISFPSREEERIAVRIQNTRVRQVSGLKTYLLLNGVKIERSVESKECFVQTPSKKVSDEQIRFYFQTGTESEGDLIHSIDEYLIKYIHYVIHFDIPEHLVMKLFHKINDPNSISLMLDKVPIDPYHLSPEVLFSVFPDPGTYVPVELHHLLNCDFSDFKPHEYHCVALELEDAGMLDNSNVSETYIPVYIYVRIERKLSAECEVSVISQKYEVFTGSEIVVVAAFKIYKFIRSSRENACTDVVDAGGIPQPRNNQSLNEVFYSVRHTLQEAWQLPEEDRRHIIKRLYLRWHPDKNVGNEEFCSDVFKYIKEVIYKLEHGISLDDNDATDGPFRQSRAYPDFTSSQYFSFCERMNNRSRSHREQARTFDNAGRSHQAGSEGYGSNFTHRDSCNRPYPDIGEAHRWQRQAVVDLRNALETIDARGDPPAYNWICYMCHQASEKSLKAAGFARDANSLDKNSHDISRLASGLSNEIRCLASALSTLVGFHTQMRYPDVLQRPHIPSTVYTRDQAVQACEFARQILDLVNDNYLS